MNERESNVFVNASICMINIEINECILYGKKCGTRVYSSFHHLIEQNSAEFANIAHFIGS